MAHRRWHTADGTPKIYLELIGPRSPQGHAGALGKKKKNKPLLVRKFSKPEDGLYRLKHVVFSPIANKHHHLAIFIVVCLTEFTSPYSLNTQRGWHTADGTPQMAHRRFTWN